MCCINVADGNCQFRSASFNLFGTQSHHQYVRQKVVAHILRNSANYSLFFEGNEFDTYIDEMSQTRTWGDELTIRAIADYFECVIHIFTTTPTNYYLRYDPELEDGKANPSPVRHLFFTYISPIHYNSFRMQRSTGDHSLLAQHEKLVEKGMVG
eukprot:GHVN01059617.1.p2 GENE.GHVN01059617.1~~GHVN01059617.1.p2  ORF type:complete len:154 (-),score=14.38 GHVN01059617.1:602-1063(-)